MTVSEQRARLRSSGQKVESSDPKADIRKMFMLRLHLAFVWIKQPPHELKKIKN